MCVCMCEERGRVGNTPSDGEPRNADIGGQLFHLRSFLHQNLSNAPVLKCNEQKVQILVLKCNE